MFKRMILPLILITAAVAVGLVLPTGVAMLQERRTEAVVEPLGLELEAVSLGSGLSELDKWHLLNQPETGMLAVSKYELSEKRELDYLHGEYRQAMGDRTRLLLTNENRAFLVDYLSLTDGYGNQWELYEDVETGELLGMSLEFFWVWENWDAEMDGQAPYDIAISEWGIDLSTSEWAVSIVFQILQNKELYIENYGYDVDYDENVVYFDLTDGTNEFTMVVYCDETGCQINCNNISE